MTTCFPIIGRKVPANGVPKEVGSVRAAGACPRLRARVAGGRGNAGLRGSEQQRGAVSERPRSVLGSWVGVWRIFYRIPYS